MVNVCVKMVIEETVLLVVNPLIVLPTLNIIRGLKDVKSCANTQISYQGLYVFANKVSKKYRWDLVCLYAIQGTIEEMMDFVILDVV